MKKRVVSIVGARPQFIKAATVSRALRAMTDLEESLIHTGQHYDDNMSQVFFDQLELQTPDYHLGIGSGSHGAQTGRMLEAIEAVMMKEKPDWTLVYGDTNSTLAGALAAAKLHIPVAHVEAGLRSFNRQMPEEINRILTDHVSDLLFAPTITAVENLHREGIRTESIMEVGDVMYDAALYYGAKAEHESCILEQLGLETQNYVLATIHRAENTDAPTRLRAIFNALEQVAKEIAVIVPLHPRTDAALRKEGASADIFPHLRLIDPIGYLDMIRLEKHARLIATDSGGVQKEAFFYRVPCVTLREETEWVELVALDWNRLLPPQNADRIAAGIRAGLSMRGMEGSPYGDGSAAHKIVMALREHCGT